ncbi:TatD family hydrolase [Micromonospora carbonacea]|uniref:TatD DNase family protein n=1 Tax=Micromonospora carbonacea TaxID=47853 RepID=A0A1C4YGY2_9ACTN|nr:TatD family hydrolase [Micromonospora carbonacea]SCF19896.1 TatD DNase family protein [Micromonospora carbonacea]
MLLDTHCHIDVYPDPIAVLNQAKAAGVHVVAVTEDPGRFRLLRTRLGRRDGIHLGIGLHPLRVTTHYCRDLDRLSRLLPDADWVGEVGLDFSKGGAATKALQVEAFEALLAIDAVLRKPITVHSRGAERDTVTRLLQTNVVAVLHWYTGSIAVAEQAVTGGLWFSVNPAMIRSSRAGGLLRTIPPRHVVLETDGPYARCAGRPAHPADLPAVAEHLAGVWGLPRGAALAQIASNQQRLAAMLRPESA